MAFPDVTGGSAAKVSASPFVGALPPMTRMSRSAECLSASSWGNSR